MVFSVVADRILAWIDYDFIWIIWVLLDFDIFKFWVVSIGIFFLSILLNWIKAVNFCKDK